MRRPLALILVLLGFVVVIGGLGWFQFVMKPNMIRGFIAKAAPPPTTVAVERARSETWVHRIPAIGTFRAVAGIDIAPQVAGVVSKVLVKSGDKVSQGQLLVNLDDSVEQADLQSDLAAYQNASVSYDRQAQLVRGGNTAKAQVDQALAARDQAAAAVAKERALIAQKALTAPFAGRLGLRNIDPGQYVSPGASIMTLQALDPILVDFPVPEQNLGLLRIGETVEVLVDAYPNRTFTGRIASIDARVSSDTRNVTVRAQLDNKDEVLLPGMFANVEVDAGAAQTVTTLQKTAIAYSLYGDSVFVVKPVQAGGSAGSAEAASPADQVYSVEARPVQVGDTQGDRVAIASGISPGEQVISEGQIKLTPGARVKIDNRNALPPRLTPRPQE